MSQDLEKMGEDIRVQGGQGSGTMTGEFETKAEGTSVEEGEMNVTEMTKEGFAY